MEKTLELPAYKVVAAGRQIVGKRERQEDAFRLTVANPPGQPAHLLSILSDGMGGMGDGDIAGVAIVSAFLEAYKKQPEKDLFAALRSANLALREMKKNGNVGSQAGGTFIGLQVGEEGVSWLSIGDSLLYHQKDGKVRKINAEHTWGRELERRVQQGEMTEREAEESTLPKHALFAAVCGDNIPAVDVCAATPCRAGERFIIASDGLLTILSDPEAVFNEPGISQASPEQACTALLDKVNAAGSPHQDNCSVLIIDICTPAPAAKEPAAEVGSAPADRPAGAWHSCVVSEIGDRDSQQDSTLVLHSENAVLAVVADGAGGHADGAGASSTAVDCMKELWNRTLAAGLPAEKAVQELSDGIIAAHQSILQKAGGNHKRCGKSAIVVLYLCGQHYTIANAGDCRCYQATHQGWQLLTKDDSLLQLMLDKGMVTPEEAINHPDQSVLTQALGGETPPKPHVVQGEITKGSSYLLCCDGLWNQLPPHWADTPWSCEPDTAAHHSELSRRAGLAIKNANGDSDNVSAIWVYGKDNTPAPRSSMNGLAVILAILLTLLFGLVSVLLYTGLPQDTETPRKEDQETTQQGTGKETTQQGTDTETTQQGTDTETTQQGTDTETTQQGTDTETTQQGTDTGTTQQGTDTGTTQQGTDTGTTQQQEPQQPVTPSATLLREIKHEDNVRSIAFSPDGKFLATGSGDKTARITEVATGRTIREIEHNREVLSVAFSPDGKSLATGSCDPIARITAVATGRTIRKIKHDILILGLAFSPDGKFLATSSMDKIARITELATGRTVREIKHDNTVNSVSFSPDGQSLATGSNDNTARITDLATGGTLRELKHDKYVDCVAFSPDSQFLATGSDDNTARITEVATGNTIQEIKHTNTVSSVAFSPDGRFLATGSNDNTARITEIATGRTIQEIEHNARVSSIAFSPDGKFLATGSDDGTARIYELKETEE